MTLKNTRNKAAGWVSRARLEIRRDAVDDWSLSPRLAELLFLVPFVGAVLVAASRLDLSLFRFITSEDRLLEWSQFAAYAATVPVALFVALRLRRNGARLGAGVFLLLAVGALLVAGEEISWGQRIFGVETPENLRALNRQGEIGVHNVSSVEHVLIVGFMLAGLYGSLVPWLALRRPLVKERLGLFVPPLYLTSFFFVVFLHRLARLALPALESDTAFVKFGEWPELCFATALLQFALLTARGKLRAPSPAPAGAAATGRGRGAVRAGRSKARRRLDGPGLGPGVPPAAAADREDAHLLQSGERGDAPRDR
jgi:hypothetical protein